MATIAQLPLPLVMSVLGRLQPVGFGNRAATMCSKPKLIGWPQKAGQSHSLMNGECRRTQLAVGDAGRQRVTVVELELAVVHVALDDPAEDQEHGEIPARRG